MIGKLNPTASYESVNQALIEHVPELRPAYRELIEWWGEQGPGPHVVYGDLLNPYIDEMLQVQNIGALTRVFSLLEELAASPDLRVRDLLGATVCEFIVADSTRMRRLREFMGQLTQMRCEETARFRLG